MRAAISTGRSRELLLRLMSAQTVAGETSSHYAALRTRYCLIKMLIRCQVTQLSFRHTLLLPAAALSL